MDLPALQQLSQRFCQELQKAAAGEQTSLPFIKHQLPDRPLVQVGETFQVVVIGGSVYRKSIMKKEPTTLLDLFYEEHDQPVFHDKDHFLSYIVSHLESHISTVAMNFAYPMTPTFTDGKLDGTLLYGTKENEFAGLTGEHVGQSIETYFKEKTGKAIHVSVANDVICLLLSGLQQHPKESLVGGIMGTGTNIAFFHDDFAVNLESANFSGFPPSEQCLSIDKTSALPGKALFEKETSGAYLYHHYNLILKKEHLPYPPIASTKELKQLALHSPIPHVKELAASLIKKSAGMLAAQMAGIAQFKDSDITVIMEGSFFWKDTIYQEFFSQYINELSPQHKITVIKVENSSILGGAKLVT